MNKHIALMVAALVALSVQAYAQFDVSSMGLTSQLPNDPNVTIGKLPNGMTYYLRTNKKPEKRMELRLVVNAGSVLEDDDQQGLAHLVEHMAFNGTKNFPKMDLINFLESSGVRFGADLNAYTDFDETVYMLQVPTDKPDVVQKAIQVIEDWSHNLTMDSVEIDKERGVVGEEWRLGRGANARVDDKQAPTLFHNSQYASRNTIGLKPVIDTAHYETLRRFYRDWYRPDLMAVVLVGDFDRAQMEAAIKQHFGSLTSPANPRERTQFKLPDHPQPLVTIVTDKELPFPSVEVIFKHPRHDVHTIGEFRTDMIGAIYDGMLSDRLEEIAQKTNPPFAFASASDGRFLGDKGAFTVRAFAKEDNIAGSLDVLLREVYRAKQSGFTQTELDRQRQEMLTSFTHQFDERDKIESRRYAREYISNFLYAEPIPGIENELALYKRFLSGVKLDEVNALTAERIIGDGNCVIAISAPEKTGVTVPTEAEVLKMLNEARTTAVAAYRDDAVNKPLMSVMPTSGKVVSEKATKALGIVEWKLSNGVRVVLKKTDFKNDEVLMAANGPGGTSLADDLDYYAVNNAGSIVGESGVGDFDKNALRKALSGKIANVSPFIGSLQQGLRGSSSTKDLETMMQLIHLYFTAPRKDSAALDGYRTMMGMFVKNRSNTPEGLMQDVIQITMSSEHFRAEPSNARTLAAIDLNKCYNFYKMRFADASGFTFFFTGNFDVATMKSLVAKYIASLPSENYAHIWRDEGIMPPTGVVKKEIRKGTEPKASVQLIFTGPFVWSVENRYALQSTIDVLRIKLREVMREDKSGVYGVRVSGNPMHYPQQRYSITVGFGCAPERVDELVATALAQIDSLKVRPVTEEYIHKVTETQRRDLEVSMKENRFWLDALQRAYWDEENPMTIIERTKLIDSFNAASVLYISQQYFNMTNYAKFVLLPEKPLGEK